VADVSDTLDALERKLRDLERELGAPATSAPVPPPPAPGRPVAPAAGGTEDLARQIDELARFREQLQRVGRELEAEYERVLARLGQEVGTPAVADAPAATAAAAPVEPAPPGVTVVDAGPFADLAALGSFEAAVGVITGVTAVEITGFEGRRAIAEVRTEGAVALPDALAAVLPGAAVRAGAAADRLVVDLGATT
jgi:sarcosine oxidase gamma subunit